MSLPARVLRTVRKHRMIPRGGRVLVALSGGPDSVALLHVLRALERQHELEVAGVAHFNHRLRGDAAESDERFCRDLAAGLELPIEVGGEDVRALARAQHRSLEDAARTARYAFLEAAADRMRADAIAVGHSLDDQAETFLLRLLRGAGPRGLGGIRPKARRIVRPFLETSREDIRAYAAACRLAFREDATNADVSIPRNRIRHQLLPLLRDFSPGAVEVLARDAGIAREDEDFLSLTAIDLGTGIVLLSERGIEVDVNGVRALHPAVGSRVVREALARAAPSRFFGHEHIRATLDLASRADGAAVSVPGLMARREGDRIVLGPRPPKPFSNSFRFPLSIPGEVAVAEWAVSAQALSDGSQLADPLRARAATVAVAANMLKLPLAVRSRRPGDRFRPLGMKGRARKLQDFLVDRKVCRNERDTLPLVVDSDDTIVWVVGQSVGEEFRVTAPTQAVILLKVRRLGGEG